MKTKTLPELLPPLPPDDAEEFSGHWIKIYFCGCALTGAIASQEEACPTREDENAVARAYNMAMTMYDIFTTENPTAIESFNRKVGL